MEVVTYLTSTLMVAASIAAVALAFWFRVKRRSRRKWGDHSSESMAMLMESELSPTPSWTNDSASPSMEDFFHQYTPAESDLHIYTNLAMFGPTIYPITVHNGGRIVIFGTCANSVVVRPGGVAIIYGTITGNLSNEGGEIDLHGTVIGEILRSKGRTSIHPTARTSLAYA